MAFALLALAAFPSCNKDVTEENHSQSSKADQRLKGVWKVKSSRLNGGNVSSVNILNGLVADPGNDYIFLAFKEGQSDTDRVFIQEMRMVADETTISVINGESFESYLEKRDENLKDLIRDYVPNCLRSPDRQPYVVKYPKWKNSGWEPGSWMSLLPGDRPVCCVNIPGTHDSATSTANMGFVSTTVNADCQSLSIEEQYDAGARYFDFRVGQDFVWDLFPVRKRVPTKEDMDKLKDMYMFHGPDDKVGYAHISTYSDANVNRRLENPQNVISNGKGYNARIQSMYTVHPEDLVKTAKKEKAIKDIAQEVTRWNMEDNKRILGQISCEHVQCLRVRNLCGKYEELFS